jgi:hypothetical protein
MRTLQCVLSVICLTAAGCGVNAGSGTRDLPVELRSSSDARRPLVGQAGGPATRPSAMDKTGRNLKALFVDLPRLGYEQLTGKTVLDAANKLTDPAPGERRLAISKLVARDVGKGLPYTDVYKSMGQIDADPLVRATAIRALNRARDDGARPLIVAALKDGHPQVRLEAAKALCNLPDANSQDRLRVMLADSNEPVDNRIAAADALRHFDNLDTSRALVAQLTNQNFAIAWQSRRSLYLMTGMDHRYDEAEWLRNLAR